LTALLAFVIRLHKVVAVEKAGYAQALAKLEPVMQRIFKIWERQ
jgi:hypothetical protein